MYNNFEMSLVVFMPNITTNRAITYTDLGIDGKAGPTFSSFNTNACKVTENIIMVSAPRWNLLNE